MLWLHTADDAALWPATDAISRGLENPAARLLLVRTDPDSGQVLAHAVLEVRTPSGARQMWREFLHPPRLLGAPPPYSLHEISCVEDSWPGALLLRPDWTLPEPAEPAAHVHVMLATLHLDRECLLLVAEHVVRRLAPGVGPLLPAWDGPVPGGLGEALLEVHALEAAARAAACPRQAPRAQARADAIWMERVLLLGAERADRAAPPAFFEEARFAPPLLPAGERPPMSGSSRLERIALVESLGRWAHKYPELPVQDALEWLRNDPLR
jgi:hypothetical protein